MGKVAPVGLSAATARAKSSRARHLTTVRNKHSHRKQQWNTFPPTPPPPAALTLLGDLVRLITQSKWRGRTWGESGFLPFNFTDSTDLKLHAFTSNKVKMAGADRSSLFPVERTRFQGECLGRMWIYDGFLFFFRLLKLLLHTIFPKILFIQKSAHMIQ